MKYEFSACREAFPLRYHLLGHGAETVVLDPGYEESLSTWSEVASEIATFARVILLDRAGYAPEMSVNTATEVSSIARLITSPTQQAEQEQPLVLVGWAVGACTIQMLAMAQGIKASAMVLVDPSPAPQTAGVSGRDQAVSFRSYFPQDIPVTVILPGIQPDRSNHSALRRQALQQQFLRRMGLRREVIAGGSKGHIPKERPDVVIDAITYYLRTQ